MSALGPRDELLVAIIGWCWRRLTPPARLWLVTWLPKQRRDV